MGAAWHVLHALWHVLEILIGRLPLAHWYLDSAVFATGIWYAVCYWKMSSAPAAHGGDVEYELANTNPSAQAQSRRDRRLS